MLSRRALFGLGGAAAITSLQLASCAVIPVTKIAPAVPRIAVCSNASTNFEISPDRLIDTMQRYVDEYLTPAWGVRARIEWTKAPVMDKQAWNIVITDQELGGSALAYHTESNELPPYAPVQADVCMQYNGNITAAITHELGEMLVNPGINKWASLQPVDSEDVKAETLVMMELADPVQENWFKIDGVPVSDFVYPSYFEPWQEPPYDQMGVLGFRKISPGGYQIEADHGTIHQWIGPRLQVKEHVGAEAPLRKCWRYIRALERYAAKS